MNIWVTVLALLTSIAIARALGPEGRGAVAEFTLWVMTIAQVALLGVHMQLSRDAAKPYNDARSVYRQGMVIFPLLALIALGLYLLLISFFPDVLGMTPTALNLSIAGVTVLFSMWNAAQIQIENGRSEIITFSRSKIAFAILNAAIALLLWLQGENRVEAYAYGFAASAALSTFYTQFLIVRGLPETTNSSQDPSWTSSKRLIQRSIGFSGAITIAAIVAQIDKIAVSLAFNNYVMGIYVVAFSLSQIQTLINQTISPLLFARSAQMYSLDDEGGSAEVSTVLRQAFLMNILACLIAVSLAPFLVPLLFGDAFRPAIPLIMILIPALGVKHSIRPYEDVLRGGNRPMSQTYASLLLSAVFIIGVIPAAMSGSLVGIGFAMMAASLSGLILAVFLLAKHMKRPFSSLILPRLSDIRTMTRRLRDFLSL